MSSQPKSTTTGILSNQAIDLLAELLLSTSDCELCGQLPQEHYIDRGEWQGKHACSRCWESLPDQQEAARDA